MSEQNDNESLQSLAIDDVIYKTKLTRKFMERKFYTPLDPKKVIAFIPGTIQEIKVKVGDKVNAGDTLILLESMKMLNDIKAPLDGVIKEIHVNVGQKIPKSFFIMEFE
ncbi:MAG: acetyl-CoA carboxylase biotin carboxyl carrier protein subunit [Bacteroidota bacterium]|nr:acetyl-CoA carboxylase biotin carboxyl carrier protein subunit [Bacteroidota bacterium]